MALDHVLALVEQDRIRILEPHLNRHLDGVVAPPQKVVHNVFVLRLLAAIGHFPALPAHKKLHHVAVLGHFNAVMVGPLVEFEEILGSQVGIALEERGNVPLLHLILHVEPRLPAQRLHHGVQLLPRLLRVLLRCVVGRLRLRLAPHAAPSAPSPRARSLRVSRISSFPRNNRQCSVVSDQKNSR